MLPALAAQAADWRYREPQAETAVQSTGFVTARDDSIWTWDDYAVRRSDRSGATQVVLRSATVFGMAAQALDDGGVLLVSKRYRTQDLLVQVTASCTFLRAGSGAAPPQLFTREDCSAVVLHADGSAWVRGSSTLYRLGADGVERQRLVFGTQETLQDLIGYGDGGVLVRSRGANTTNDRLSRIDATGTRRWESQQSSGARITTVADGGAYVAVRTTPGMTVTRLGADGTTLWSRDSLPSDTFVMTLASSADQALYVVAGSSYFMSAKPTRLLRISSDGASWWDRPVCGTLQPSLRELLTLAADGSSVVACEALNRSLLRRDANGDTLASITLPFDYLQQYETRPGRVLRVLGPRTATAPPRLIDIDDQQRIQPSVADALSDAAPQTLAAGAIEDDGSSYLLTQNALSKIGVDGRLLWRTDLPSFRPNYAALSAADGQVCTRLFNLALPGDGTSYRYTLLCLDSATGRRLWQEDTPRNSGSGVPAAITALSGGNSLALSGGPDRYTLDLRSRDGRLLRRIEDSGSARLAHIDRSGRAYVIVGTALLHYDATGQLRYRNGTLPADPRTIASDADGNAYLYGRSSEFGSLWAVDGSGNTRWVQATARQVDPGRLLVHGDAVYLQQPGWLSRHAAASGQRLWQREGSYPVQSSIQVLGNLAAEATGTALVQVYSGGDRLRFERIDAARGELLGERYAACGISCSQVNALALDADGSARVLLTSLDPGGETAVAMALPGIAGDSARIAAGQPGIAGAWGALYANGEGIALDWLPDSRTLFGAWFTYRAEGGNDPAGLRWYTLQANGVTAGVRELDLAILVTEQGQFAAGPPVAPRQVGTATLSFIDCNNGTLRYDFDAGVNDGRSGVITLSRLSPATQPCILADGSSQPANGARPPSKGFDARQSGNWYDPATGGQGLQFTVQPEGVFFAPWFTFDPADAGNDTGRQHWFTLQGDLATAVNGQVELLLVQTIGGAFDHVPTYNASAIGTATLRMQSCERAELDYRYHDDSAAGPFRARSGTLRLQRAGGCAP